MNWDPLWTRDVAGPVTHAFIVGVSGYPFAKPGDSGLDELRNVPDIASADANAMMMADWLYENRDKLAAPLASLDILHGSTPPPAGEQQYVWRHFQPPSPVKPATTDNYLAAGTAWLKRLQQGHRNVAFFFICGHGAINRSGEHCVFLADLNRLAGMAWGAHVNMFQMGSAFKRQTGLDAAFLFADSCQQFVPQFMLNDRGEGVVVVPNDAFKPTGEHVTLVSGASSNLKAFEEFWREAPPDARIRVGQFTDVLLDALSTCVRNKQQRWVVHTSSLQQDLIDLYRARRPNWRMSIFSPSFGMTPNRAIPIVYPDQPKVPVVVGIVPPAQMPNCQLCIQLNTNHQGPPFAARPPGDAYDWVPDIAASKDLHVVEARIGANTHLAYFTPDQPQFETSLPLQ